MDDGVATDKAKELSLEEVGRILTFIDGLDAAEVDLTLGDLHLVVRRRASSPASHVETAEPMARPTSHSQPSRVDVTGRPPANAAEPDPDVRHIEPEPIQAWLDREAAGGVAIVRSPMVGLFYRAKEPGAPPFVEIGSVVDPGTVVCLVEVMKLFHSVPAGASGVVEMIFISDACTVEYMQPLLAIKKS